MRTLTLVAVALLAAATSAHAQNWPTRCTHITPDTIVCDHGPDRKPTIVDRYGTISGGELRDPQPKREPDFRPMLVPPVILK